MRIGFAALGYKSELSVNKTPGRNFTKPNPDLPRLMAYETLYEVTFEGGYSNLLLPKRLEKSELDTRDRSFVTELVYGTLRMQGKHDFRIAKSSARTLAQIDPKVLLCLRLGVHQIYEMRIPDHAAVSATVELARKVAGESSGSFVNAVLRNMTNLIPQDSVPLDLAGQTDKNTYLANEFSHPDWIISAYLDHLKDYEKVAELLAANNIPAQPTLVAWPNFSSVSELVAGGAVAVPETKYAANFAGNPGSLSEIKSRKAGVQDYGSQLVTELFYATSAGITKKLRWLDMCAGPGGKSALLTALISGREDYFLANELSKARAELVRQVIKTGEVVSFDGRELAANGFAKPENAFDRILIDAPCTGLGALRRRPETRWRRSINDLKSLMQLQKELLHSASEILVADGMIAYVTCSPHLNETRFQVKEFLRTHRDFQLAPIPTGIAIGKYSSAIQEDCMFQLWTHTHGTDAMFLALLQRKESKVKG